MYTQEQGQCRCEGGAGGQEFDEAAIIPLVSLLIFVVIYYGLTVDQFATNGLLKDNFSFIKLAKKSV